MMTLEKETAIKKIVEMPTDKVSKILIFMAGMEAERVIRKAEENQKARR